MVDETDLNTSLDDVVVLLERELARLRQALEFYRLSSHPDREARIRWHVDAIDARQDALDRVRLLLQRQQCIG
jgi:hypothetical protein